jgi:hypothetical protein
MSKKKKKSILRRQIPVQTPAIRVPAAQSPAAVQAPASVAPARKIPFTEHQRMLRALAKVIYEKLSRHMDMNSSGAAHRPAEFYDDAGLMELIRYPEAGQLFSHLSESVPGLAEAGSWDSLETMKTGARLLDALSQGIASGEFAGHCDACKE